jgi:hypothetical protein
MVEEGMFMPLLIGMGLVLGAVLVIGLLMAHRSHDVDDYYERDHEGPQVIGSSYPSGLD